MEDDVDIYADLPSINLNPEKNAEQCNCKDLKKELSSLLSKLENIQRTKTNLKNNLFSLLITAKAEIIRKDKMIDDLRKRLDDITFRRSYNSEFQRFSTHKLSHQYTVVTRKYENVPSEYSQENETESHQIQFYHDEYQSRKPRDDVNRIPTVFGERLHKRIMEEEKEEKKQKALLKLNVETKTDVISKENSIIENDKENGSQFIINNDNESNIRRCSSLEPPYRNNLKKRTNEEDDRPYGHKRVKIENDKDKTHTTIEETDYLTPRYNLADNPAEYEMKYSLVKLEDKLDAAQSFKTDRVPFCDGRRAASEYRVPKQDQSCTNGWKSKAKSNSAKDRDSSNIRNDLADSSRNSRTASTSNHVLERFNSGYKKNGYRYSSPGRSYSRSRSDYDSLSSRRLRERSSRTYREKNDYKYDSQKRYKNDRSKRCYESDENDRKARYRRRERDNLRDKSRYSSSDAEDKESSRSYKKNKYETRRIKKEATSVLSDKKLHESNKAVAIIKIKKVTDSNIEIATKIKELDDSNVEGATKKKDINNPNIESVVEVTEVNNFNSDDGIHKIDDDDLRISTCKVATKVEAVLNCDIEAGDKSQTPIEKETFHQASSDVEVYLNDHNYVQNPCTNVSDLDVIQKSSLLRSECGEAASETVTSKETKAVKTIKIQSVGVKKTVSSIVKNKKDQQSKGILISHRRKAVILSDSNASMTVVMNNTNTAKMPSVTDDCNDIDSTLKPRACKISRVTAKATCK